VYTAKEVLVTFNATINGYEEIYRGVAKSFGLSDCAFWILYYIRQSEEKVTQKDICSFIYQPKQTVHAAPVEPCRRNGWHVQGDGFCTAR
jgi:hypothetical protein